MKIKLTSFLKNIVRTIAVAVLLAVAFAAVLTGAYGQGNEALPNPALEPVWLGDCKGFPHAGPIVMGRSSIAQCRNQGHGALGIELPHQAAHQNVQSIAWSELSPQSRSVFFMKPSSCNFHATNRSDSFLQFTWSRKICVFNT